MSKRIVPLALIGLLFFGVLAVAGLGFHWSSAESKPVQPSAFSHNLHMEKAGMKCEQCHQYADKGPQAGIPALKICADCHLKVAVDRPEVQKLMKYWEKQEPVPWVKVHFQQEHVYFSHKRHVKMKIDCTVCHGEVRAMDTVRKVRSLEMGWCVSCHRQNNAPTDCWTCHK